jgi:hypothetical protein
MRWILRTRHPESAVSFATSSCFDTWIFPHIPKTAGTALVEAIGRSNDVANVILESLVDQNRYSRLELLTKVTRTRRIVLSGHIHLKHWENFIRWTGREKIMTLLRSPDDIHVSNINFIMGRITRTLTELRDKPGALDADVAQWRRRYANGVYDYPVRGERDSVAAWLAMVNSPFSLDATWANELVSSTPYIEHYREMILRYLGCGDEDVMSTMQFIRRIAPVIVPINLVDRFGQQVFGVTVQRGVNAREANVLGKQDIDGSVMRKLMGRDLELYYRMMENSWRPT